MGRNAEFTAVQMEVTITLKRLMLKKLAIQSAESIKAWLKESLVEGKTMVEKDHILKQIL